MKVIPILLLCVMATITSLSGMAAAAPAAKASAQDRRQPGARPACDVELVAGAPQAAGKSVRVKVGAREAVLDGSDAPPESLRVFPADAAAVLVAVAYSDGPQHEPRGGDTLWRVPCDPATAPKKLVQFAGADFGHSALSRSGHALFFSGADGLYTLDLRASKPRRLTRASLAYCTKNEVPARDVVSGLSSSGSLLFERGCGYEHEWHAEGMRLRQPESARPVAEPAPRPRPTAVAVDASGGIWLSDGWCEDGATFNRLLRSSDRGQHWANVPVKRDAKIPFVDQPVRQVIPDGKNPKALLVFTLSCEHGGQHTEPAWLYVTEDGGATFRPVAVPPGIPNADHAQPANEADPIYAVSAPQGSLSNLVLYGQTTDQAMGNGIARWESHDLGRTWKPLAAVKTPFEKLPSSPPYATFADWKVSIEADGLYLSQPAKPVRTRIYPRR